jgi:hypothetical protein
MTIWNLLEWLAWALSAVIAAWLVYDAVMTSRRYSEEFLTHTIEDLGDADLGDLDGPDVRGAQS